MRASIRAALLGALSSSVVVTSAKAGSLTTECEEARRLAFSVVDSGGMMSGGMMGVMGGQAESPRMLQMRGETLKAMREIMMKYGKMTEGGPR